MQSEELALLGINNDALIIDHIPIGMSSTPFDDAESSISFLSLLPGGLVLVDVQTSQVVDMNPEGIEMIGLSKDDVLGKDCHTFFNN
ncbi:PAS domain-containing protein [Methanococcoides sp. SA1]|nr:PAS domain-containing protein [Methanococcoides sp. SA1]